MENFKGEWLKSLIIKSAVDQRVRETGSTSPQLAEN